MRLDYQVLLKSPPNVINWSRLSSMVTVKFEGLPV